MTTFNRILVAVKDPAARAMPAVKKAAQIARATGATIELFHSLSHTVVIDAVEGGVQGLREFQKSRIEKTEARL